jgi:gamma-glutamyltranspeptidase/glutathione hydrolase
MRGVVVCPQPRAAEVGAQVLEAGGNAFDAGLAAAFAQMVVDPFMCGLGGMGSAQAWVADTNESTVVDFHARAGSKVTPDMWAKDQLGRTPISGYTLFSDYRSELGYSSILTPGTPAGLWELHQKYATMPWKDLIQPAINVAKNGFRASPSFVNFLQHKPQYGIPDGMTRVKATSACAAIYLREDGSLHDEGNLIKNPDYASTLELLAEKGVSEFYHGELGDRIARDLERGGSFVTRDDLREFRPRVYAPLRVGYGDYTVASNNAPGGGPWLLEVLQILDGFELGPMGHSTADHLHVLGSAMKLAHEDRSRYLGDPEFVDIMLDKVFLSKEHAAESQRAIRNGTAVQASAPGYDDATTHLVAADAQGNILSMTHTLGSSSGVVTPGLGFMYNNSMKLFDPQPGTTNSIASGKARATGMCPAIVFRNGKPVLAVGAPGGSVIMSSVLQSILNVLDFDMTAVEAVSAPRIHTEGEHVWIEARVRADVCEELSRRGHPVEHRVQSYAPDFSRPQIVVVGGERQFDGGSDPRGGGGVVYAR